MNSRPNVDSAALFVRFSRFCGGRRRETVAHDTLNELMASFRVEPRSVANLWNGDSAMRQFGERGSGHLHAQQKVVTAVGRELLGFIWDIGVRVEKRAASNKAA
jgi:hypothetical protein